MIKSRSLIALLMACHCMAIGARDALANDGVNSKPNVIIILTDDLGYGDLTCYGSKTISTPRIDRMATEGARFTDFYVASPFCSPSRAALLTGRLPARCGVPYVLFPSEHTGLPTSEVTIAEILKEAGYATACIGKWHLGWRKEFRPMQHGFDQFFGMLHTNDTEEWKVGSQFHQLSTFEPMQLRDGDQVVESPVDQRMLTQQYTARALDFIRKSRERPFFMYLSHTMPHIPQYASPNFEGKSKAGLYGDCIEEIDWSTGRILDLLQELQIDNRTLVLFTSDNGSGLRSAKAKPDVRFDGHSFVGSNAPLRGGKGTTFEGGIRVPCIAWWPQSIEAGRVEKTPWSTLDLLPTIANLARLQPAKETILDGNNVTDMLIRGAPSTQSRLLPHYFGVQLQAVRKGNWKLIVPVHRAPTTRVNSLWFEHQPSLFERQHRLWPQPSLFDLSIDTAEKTDLSHQYPEVIAELLHDAVAFDEQFQQQIPPVTYLPGPKPPQPKQIRQPSDNIREWLQLSE